MACVQMPGRSETLFGPLIMSCSCHLSIVSVMSFSHAIASFARVSDLSFGVLRTIPALWSLVLRYRFWNLLARYLVSLTLPGRGRMQLGARRPPAFSTSAPD